jgi:hypothetical protein
MESDRSLVGGPLAEAQMSLKKKILLLFNYEKNMDRPFGFDAFGRADSGASPIHLHDK